MASLSLACFSVLFSITSPNILTASAIKNVELIFNENEKNNALSILANQEASNIGVEI